MADEQPLDGAYMFSQVTAIQLHTGEAIPVMVPQLFHGLFMECMRLTTIDDPLRSAYKLDPDMSGWAFDFLFRTAAVEFKAAPYLMMAVFDLHTGLASLTTTQDTEVVSQVGFNRVKLLMEHLMARSQQRVKSNQANPLNPPAGAPLTSPLVH